MGLWGTSTRSSLLKVGTEAAAIDDGSNHEGGEL